MRTFPLPARLTFWRSPEGQPLWARPALLAIAALAAVLYSWRMRDSGFASYYSLAVKSMSVSWRAFFYGALDPGATITSDKLAGSFALQAISARLFGFHAWSLTLPQIIEGLVAVLVMYRIGRRFAGPAAGLLAAGLFGLTPVVASMFGHAMEDGLLTMCLVLAADAFQVALMSGRLVPLLVSGVWVGAGFQAKMLQAWLILPAMAVTYVVAAPGDWRRKLGHLGAAGAVALAVSLSWVALYEATPDSSRPYVDGSTNNSAVAMVFGYNGVDRFGWHLPGAVRWTVGTGDADQGGDQAGGQGGGQEQSGPGPQASGTGGAEQQEGPQETGGVSKLFGARYGSQIGWLYPLALLGLAFGLITRRAQRAGLPRAHYLFWGLWLATSAAVLSNMTIAHQAYLSALAPPLAVLSAAAVVRAWNGLHEGDALWQLPVLVVAELAWTVHLSRQFPDFLPWLAWAVTAAAVVALLVIGAELVPRSPKPGRLVRTSAMALAVAAMVTVPSVWAGSVLDRRYAGDAFEASAGPKIGGGEVDTAGGNNLSPTGKLTPAQSRLDDYLTAHKSGARFVAATTRWYLVSPYIAATGHTYLPMGGNDGGVPQPTLVEVQKLVEDGELHHFLLPAPGDPSPDGGSAGSIEAIDDWVTETCAVVAGNLAPHDQLLYRCH